MCIRILPTTLLQIFCEKLLYFKVIFKSMKKADNTFLGTSECEWVKAVEKTYPDMFCHWLLVCIREDRRSGSSPVC